jgi:hypothetical protein
MSKTQVRAVGGSCLGGVLGGAFGVILGGIIGSALAGHNDPAANAPLSFLLIDALAETVVLLLGAGIGGLIGAIGGAVIGAGVAARSRGTEGAAVPDTSTLAAANFPQPPQESTGAELARLRERMVELEGRIWREEQREKHVDR